MGDQLKAVELPKRILSKLPKRSRRSIESSWITETHFVLTFSYFSIYKGSYKLKLIVLK